MTSLRRILVRRLVIGLTTALCAMQGGLFLFLRSEIVQSFDERLIETARLLSSGVHLEEGEALDLELGNVPIPEFGPTSPTAAFEVWDGDAPLYRSASLGKGDLRRPPVPNQGPVVVDAPLPDGRPGRAVVFRFAPTPEAGIQPSRRLLTLMVVQERGTLDARLRSTSLALGAVSLLLLIAMPLVVIGVVRRGLARLVALGREVDAIDVRSLDRRLSIAGLHTELVPLAERINQLLDRIEEGLDRERRFSDDVAHQLRTPIAELRALADVSLAGATTEGLNHGQAFQAFEEAREIAIQMERLATGLLAMARGEGDQVHVKTAVDLGVLARRARGETARRLAGRDVRVVEPAVHGGPPTTVIADQAIIESVVASLVDNAVAYTPAGGEIEIATETRGSDALLTVTNTDSSLSADDLARMFERFWRKDQARRNGEHSGLGLAVAQTLMRASGGELMADRPRPGMIRLTMSFQGPGDAGPAAQSGA